MLSKNTVRQENFNFAASHSLHGLSFVPWFVMVIPCSSHSYSSGCTYRAQKQSIEALGYKTLQKTGAPSAPQWERACSFEPHAATINCTRDGFLFSTKISWEEMTIIQAHSADQGHFQRHKVE
ncbi:unnamed protein product [Lepidochelys kempii]